ncbi:neuroserpin-like, partial [Culicoides brevitarsis]|uniref:neuroserpin-like n=1 Tax=Culicoides brevitarsis TaxID=469753 RepID=UPI00307B847E
MALNRFQKKSLRFGVQLYENFIQDNGNNSENIVFSPFLVHTALSLILIGAEGETQAEIGVVLKYGKNCAKMILLKLFPEILLKIKMECGLIINNQIFVERGHNLRPGFVFVAETLFDTPVTEVDFNNKDAAVLEINKYVESNTNGTIKNVISPEDITQFTRAF